MRRSQSSPGASLSIALATVVIALVIAFSLLVVKRPALPPAPVNPETSPTPTLTPTPIPLATGTGTYQVSQSAHAGPSVTEVEFSPLDARKGELLSIRLRVSNTVPVQSVRGILTTDNGSQSIEFKQTDSRETDSFWTGTVTPDAPLWYTYILTVQATAANGTGSITVAPRSP